MAHEIYTLADGRNSMGFVGDTPWHGLGQHIPADAPLEIWAKQAGLDWSVTKQPIFFDKENVLTEIQGKTALVRSDDNTALSVVSDRYQIVQPKEVLEFFKSLIDSGNFKMHTAGSIFGGRRLWALAEIGKEIRLFDDDLIRGYLLLATSLDGTLATTGQFTSVRVVCNNTLQFAVGKGETGTEKASRVPHSTIFNPDKFKIDLELAEKSFDTFGQQASELAKRKITEEEAIKYFLTLTKKEDEEKIDIEHVKGTVKKLLNLYTNAPGHNLRSADNTAWGLVNTVTRFIDHEKNTRTRDNRLNNAWFGLGASFKQKSWDEALKLAA